MNVFMFRQRVRLDLHYRANDDKVPVGTFRCNLVQQLTIEALVDDAEEPKSRMWNRRLVLRIFYGGPRFTKMRCINGAWNRMNGAVLVALRFVQTLSTCNYKIHTAEQLFFKQRQLRIGALKRR